MSGPTPGTRLRILRGDPTLEQLAALVLALDHPTAGGTAPSPRPHGWRRAARLEGLGGAPLASASDPRLQRPSPC